MLTKLYNRLKVAKAYNMKEQGTKKGRDNLAKKEEK